MTDPITRILTPRTQTVAGLARDLSMFAGRNIHRSQVQRWRAGKGISTRNRQLLEAYANHKKALRHAKRKP